MVIICLDILLIARIFPRLFGARKNTTQLARYPHVLYAKPSIKMYILLGIIWNSEHLVPKYIIDMTFIHTLRRLNHQWIFFLTTSLSVHWER